MKLFLVILVHLMFLSGNTGLKYRRCSVPTSGRFISFSVSGCGDADYCEMKNGSNLTLEAKFESLINVTYIRPDFYMLFLNAGIISLRDYDGCNHAGVNAILLKDQVCDYVVIADIEKDGWLPARMPLGFKLQGFTTDTNIKKDLLCVTFESRVVRK